MKQSNMQGKYRHKRIWMALLAALLLTTACSHDHEPEATYTDADTPVLRIYVYAPEHPVVTRADNGQVNPLDDGSESVVNSLQIWVFRHDDGTQVAYYSPSSVETLNRDANDIYEIAVSKAFAQERPQVDIYAIANASLENCGNAFNEQTSRAELDAARMGHTPENDHFGLTALTTAVPQGGLPLTGVLNRQNVVGESPVLRIGTEEQMATVRLVRTVSKVRFVFSNATGNTEKLHIESVTLNGGVIPTEEYLFLEDEYTPRSCRVGSAYEPDESLLFENLGEITTHCTDPRDYAYSNQTGQDYETLINRGIANRELTAQGPFYLRESDQKLQGSIRYRIDDNEAQTITFQMADAGDFSRNHTWIVYAYYYGGDDLRLSSAYVREWKEEDRTHEVYNW